MSRYFPAVYGNENTKKRIGRAIKDKRAPHAYLIDGGEGSGKLTLALSIAAALNCEKTGKEEHSLPCGDCSSCKRILNKIHPDVKILEKDSDKATIGVRQIKDFREDMFLSPTEAEGKVYIIRDADKMTVEAQNALLIVLEEPPHGTKIILLASGCDKILTTIKSRAQYISMERFSESELVRYLEENHLSSGLTKEKLSHLILLADGRIGRARALVNSEELEEWEKMREDCFLLLASFKAGAESSLIYRTVTGLPDKRQLIVPILEQTQNALRDLITVKYSEIAPLLFFTNTNEARDYADAIGRARAQRLFDLISSLLEDFSQNANVNAALHSFAASIKEI